MAGGPPTQPYMEEISRLSFFFDDFKSSDEAADYVISHDRGPGTFLLRPSTRSPGTLTLTISIDNNHARHVNVQRRADAASHTGVLYYIIPERAFSSFHDLYAYYTVSPICNMEMVNNVKLLNPLTRAANGAAPAPAPSLPPVPRPPVVSKDEIPPLPRKNSESGTLRRQSGPGEGGVRRTSDGSQIGLPELPAGRRERPSLDSQGNDRDPTSSGSSGSGVGAGAGRSNPGAAAAPHQGAQQYIAPGSPGFGSTDFGDHFGNVNPPTGGAAAFPATNRVNGAPGVSGMFGASGNPASATSASNPNLPSPGRQGGQMYENSVSTPNLNMTQKELKKQQREAEKAAKQKKKEKKKKQDRRAEMGWCRPPIPVPVSEQTDEHPYYSTPRQYKDHLEDLKKMLRESEVCDCGLRMIDAELVDGWTVHRSREETTRDRVFYQHENGNTTWIFPSSIADQLSEQQLRFIVHLCRQGSQDLPTRVLQRYQAITQSGARPLPSTSSTMSSRSRSDSNSSDPRGSQQSLNRNATLDKRLPMPRPGPE